MDKTFEQKKKFQEQIIHLNTSSIYSTWRTPPPPPQKNHKFQEREA